MHTAAAGIGAAHSRRAVVTVQACRPRTGRIRLAAQAMCARIPAFRAMTGPGEAVIAEQGAVVTVLTIRVLDDEDLFLRTVGGQQIPSVLQHALDHLDGPRIDRNDRALLTRQLDQIPWPRHLPTSPPVNASARCLTASGSVDLPPHRRQTMTTPRCRLPPGNASVRRCRRRSTPSTPRRTGMQGWRSSLLPTPRPPRFSPGATSAAWVRYRRRSVPPLTL